MNVFLFAVVLRSKRGTTYQYEITGKIYVIMIFSFMENKPDKLDVMVINIYILEMYFNDICRRFTSISRSPIRFCFSVRSAYKVVMHLNKQSLSINSVSTVIGTPRNPSKEVRLIIKLCNEDLPSFPTRCLFSITRLCDWSKQGDAMS